MRRAIAALLLAACAALAAPAQATLPGRNGRLVFERFAVGIVTMAPDGGQVVLRGASGAQWLEPSWSPDASLIAFQGPTPGDPRGRSVWVVNADGSSPFPLLDGKEPAWSPDGTRIALARRSAPRDRHVDVWVARTDGSGATRLTDSDPTDRSPAWSPNGRRIAFVSDRDGNLEIYVIAADGSGETRLTHDAAPDAQHSWSPDGATIAFTRGGASEQRSEIWLMGADGRDRRRLYAGPELDRFPVFSPDGTRLAFTRTLPNAFGVPTGHVMSAAPDGGDLRDLSRDDLAPGAGKADWARIPPAIPPPVTPPGGPAARVRRLAVARGAVTATRSGAVVVRVSCPGGRRACAGTLVLTAARAVHCRRDRLRRGARLGARRYVVAPARAGRIAMRLSRRPRRVLGCARRLRVRASARASDRLRGTTSATLLVRAPRRGRSGS